MKDLDILVRYNNNVIKHTSQGRIKASQTVERRYPSFYADKLTLGLQGISENVVSIMLASQGLSIQTPEGEKTLETLAIVPTPEGSLLANEDRSLFSTDFFYTVKDGKLQAVKPSKPITLDGLHYDGISTKSDILVNIQSLFESAKISELSHDSIAETLKDSLGDILYANYVRRDNNATMEPLPNSASDFLKLGIAYGLAKKYWAASDFFEQCLGIDPNSKLAAKNLAISYSHLRWHKDALKWAREILRMSSDEVKDIEINSLANLGKHEEATRLAQQELEKDPNKPRNYYLLGLCLLAQGYESKAREYHREGLKRALGDNFYDYSGLGLNSIVDRTLAGTYKMLGKDLEEWYYRTKGEIENVLDIATKVSIALTKVVLAPVALPIIMLKGINDQLEKDIKFGHDLLDYADSLNKK